MVVQDDIKKANECFGMFPSCCISRPASRNKATLSTAHHCYRAQDEETILNSRNPRAPDKDLFLFPRMPISLPNPMIDHLLESSHRDDSNKWSNKGFGKEITQVDSIEVNFTYLIWSSLEPYHDPTSTAM